MCRGSRLRVAAYRTDRRDRRFYRRFRAILGPFSRPIERGFHVAAVRSLSIHALNESLQPLQLPIPSVHLARVDREREGRGGMAHLRHQVRRALAQGEQDAREGPTQGVRRQALGEFAVSLRRQLLFCLRYCLRQNATANVAGGVR